MKSTLYGALAGFLISLIWIALGFIAMLVILAATLVGAAIGYWLHGKGLGSPSKLAATILNKITD